MSEIKANRQKPISVTNQEHKALENQRRRYEDRTGDTGDWGKFLGVVSLLGLAALGVYGLVKASERSEQSAKAKCPNCNRVFPIALANERLTVVQVPCPYCNSELVVNLGTIVPDENTPRPFADWSGRCPNCGEAQRILFVSRPPYHGEQVNVTCRQCGEPFIIGQQVYETSIDDREL